jgi:hypothetical protein
MTSLGIIYDYLKEKEISNTSLGVIYELDYLRKIKEEKEIKEIKEKKINSKITKSIIKFIEKNPCKHLSYIYCHKKNKIPLENFNCSFVCNQIIKNIKILNKSNNNYVNNYINNYNITKKFIELLVAYTDSARCIFLNEYLFEQTLNILLNNLDILELHNLFKDHYNTSSYKIFNKYVALCCNNNLLYNNNCKLSVNYMCTFLDTQFDFINNFNINLNLKTILDVILDYSFRTNNYNFIEKLSILKLTYVSNKILEYVKQADNLNNCFNNNIQLISRLLELLCRNFIIHKEVITYIYNVKFIDNYSVQLKLIKTICAHNDVNSIKEAYSIIVNNKVYFNCLLQQSHKEHSLNNRLFEQKYHNKYYEYYDYDKLNMLLTDLNYVVTRNDLLNSISEKKEIINITKYKLIFDQEILQKCYKTNFYPNYTFNCINTYLYNLQKMCYQDNLNNILKYSKLNNIKLDKRCIINILNNIKDVNLLDIKEFINLTQDDLLDLIKQNMSKKTISLIETYVKIKK